MFSVSVEVVSMVTTVAGFVPALLCFSWIKKYWNPATYQLVPQTDLEAGIPPIPTAATL